MRIVAISDTHNRHKQIEIPPCDILISAGDWSFQGMHSETESFAKWLNKQEAGYIVVVPGNHERTFEKMLPESRKWITDNCPAAHLLIDESVVIEGFKIHGSPVQPWFHNWAWNRERGPDIKKHWDMIPDDTNVLITHGPPAGILDIVYQVDGVTPRERVGCHDLYEKVMSLKDLKHHIFGHIHCSYGHQEHNGKHFWNAAICDEMYAPSNPIHIIDL